MIQQSPFFPWEKIDLNALYDGVLIRSVNQYRKALCAIERHESPRANRHVRYLRRGLRFMENELERRGLGADGKGRQSKQPRHAASSPVPAPSANASNQANASPESYPMASS